MKYVCVFNRNRDNYEAAIALRERGLLRSLVTDFYAAEESGRWTSKSGAIARRRPSLRGRSRPELDGARVVSVPSAFATQVVRDMLSISPMRFVKLIDIRLAAAAAKEAAPQGDGVFAYTGNLPRRYLAENPQAASILFQFHPHADLCHRILSDDVRRHPEVRWSYQTERDSNQVPGDPHADEWRHADRIVCASAFTGRSLEHAGCDPAKFLICPYGAEAIDPPDPNARRQDGITRFLFVGQGLQRKGLHHLAHAWRAAALPQAELTVVSYRIDPGIEPLLRQPNVTVKQFVARDELLGLFRAADVFVMPSLIEGFGLVYLEALERGCFVIGTPNTGLPDLSLSEGAARLCEPGEVESVVEALKAAKVRHAGGGIDPLAIHAEANRHRWADFRALIGEGAARLIAEKAERPGLRRASSP